MSEYENPNELPKEDPYTYYAGTPSTPSEYRYVPEPKTKKKKQPWLPAVGLVLCCSLLSAACGVGGVLLMQHLQEEKAEEVPEQEISYIMQGVRENSVIEMVEVETGKLMTPAEVYAANVNSTVGITTSVTTNFWGYQSTSAASGSGFVISDDGYILTNFHVIEDSDSISVSMYNGDSYEADLIGYDESNDIAVLKIEAEGLAPVILGDSNNLNVGDSVVAIGNPLGELTFTLTSGAISAKDREVTLSGNVTMNLLQTDCAINSGNSGGALVGAAVGVSMVKVGINYNAMMPKNLKKIAQIMSGAYIGCAITMEALLGIADIFVPLVFIMGCYLIVMYFMGNLLHKKFGMKRKEAMLMMTPAGASDMALVASEMGIDSPALIVVQVARLFVADAIMPQVCYTVAQMLG